MNKNWLGTCVTAGEFLYGEYPMDVLLKLYATKGEKVTKEEVMEFYDSSFMMLCDGEMFSPLIVTEGEMLAKFKEADKNGNPYASLHYDLAELQVLRKEQSLPGLEYWIPNAAQIDEIVSNGFICTRQFTALEKEVVRRGCDPAYLINVWQQISTDKSDGTEALGKICSGFSQTCTSIEELNSTMPLVNDFYNSVNLRARKGWRPGELFKKQHPHGLTSMPTIVPGSAHAAQMMKQAEGDLRAMGANVDYSSIDSYATVGQYGERKVVKVGRNDPCPCGSGKKYKHCHGR